MIFTSKITNSERKADSMKKVMRKILVAIVATLSLTMLSSTSLLSVAAEEPVVPSSAQTVAVQDSGETISPRGDIIEIKYRVFNGKIQYRRWNVTQQKWVDSEWIDM